MDVTKIIKAKIGHSSYVVAEPIMKEDYGLYLLIEGIDLPQSYEVDFSNELRDGTSITMIGDANGVRIPEQFIEPGRNVYAFYYHVGYDFGRTLYTIRIPNKARPERTDETPTPVQQSAVDQAIAALNTAVERTAQDVISADQSAQEAGQSAEQAHEASIDAQNFAEQAEQSAASASQSASQASTSASSAAQSASQSAQIKTDVEGMVDDAQASASESAQSASSAATSASTATTKAAEAAASAASVGEAAQTATAKAAEASASASTASTKASEAAASASTASTKASEAQAAKTAAQTAQTAAQTAQTAAETAQTAAEDAQEAAETAAESIEASAAQIAQNTSDIAGVKRDLNDKVPVIIETASGSIASFEDGADDMPMKSLIVNIEPAQSGSGDPSPDNVRPISGWTGCEVQRTGKNLLKLDESEMVISGWNRVFPISLKAGTYIISCQNKFGASTRGASVTLTDENDTNIIKALTSGYIFGDTAFVGIAQTITEEQAKSIKHIRFALRAAGATFADVEQGNIQLELASTATPYEPYNGATYSISWASEAGTVYGGTLDVVSGLLTVDRAMVDLGTQNWNYNSNWNGGGAFYITLSDAKNGVKTQVANIICENYTTVSRDYLYDNPTSVGIGLYDKALNLRDSNYTDAATFKSAMSGVQLVYELATPQTYQLTPTEVKSILGLNNIWADCGDVEVEYRADTKMFVESQIPDVPVEDVQINGTSIVSDGVAEIPKATNNVYGVGRSSNRGVQLNAQSQYITKYASDSEIKAGSEYYNVISPYNQHQSTFYGLAKSAGVDMASSSNAVGQYTDEAKRAIREMLGLPRYTEVELIADVTTEEDLSELVINTDQANEPFKLRFMRLYISYPPSTTGASSYTTVHIIEHIMGSNDLEVSLPTLQITATGLKALHFFKTTNGIAEQYSYFDTSSINKTLQAIRSYNTMNLIEYVSAIKLTRFSTDGTLIPAGTRIIIHGIRY